MSEELFYNILLIAGIAFAALYAVGILVIIYHLVRFGKQAQLRQIKPYENVLLFLRRHWFVLFLQLLALCFIGLVPLAALIIIPLTGIVVWLTIWFYLLWSYALFYILTMYLLDIWIITDHRIIDSQQHGFFKRVTAEINLAKIQDIQVTIQGIIPTFLDYGSLEVQSAGAAEKFFFQQIPRPNSVRDTIMEAHNEFIETHPNDLEIHELGPMSPPGSL